MITQLLPLISFLMLSFSVHAIYLESMVDEMQPQESFISSNIFNNSERLNLYSVNIFKIDRPGPEGKRISTISDGELLFAPLKFTLEPQGLKYFKFYYRGPSDNKERYYRVSFHEDPVSSISSSEQIKSSSIFPSVVVDTILIVRPRKLDFGYSIDEEKGVIINTGNTFFKVIVHKTCNSDDDESTIRYILPQESWISEELKRKSQKFIVALNKYIPVGYSCSQSR